MGGNIPGGKFPGGSLMGGNFPLGEFSQNQKKWWNIKRDFFFYFEYLLSNTC